MPKLGFEETLGREVLSKGRCVGCAACVIACPFGVLDYVEGKPNLIGECKNCGICGKVCQALEFSEDKVENLVFGRSRSEREVFGVYRDIFAARATDESILKSCQDGGVVTALLYTGLDKGIIESAVVSGLSEDKPFYPVPKLISKKEEALESAGTRYTYSPNLLALKEGVEKKVSALAFVGTPCQIRALRKIQEAGLKKYVQKHGVTGQTLVTINSGANMNFERLRYVSERTQAGEGSESLFAVTIPEKTGALRYFCSHILDKINITEFNYRLADRTQAQLFIGVSIGNGEEREGFASQLNSAGYKTIDLSDNELAKTHLRYMIGGRSAEANRERLFRFWFPERPDALTKFLADMGEGWNITLFHYRSQGGEFGRVLIGLEIPEQSEQQLKIFFDNLGYHYIEETKDPAYQLFLH